MNRCTIMFLDVALKCSYFPLQRSSTAGQHSCISVSARKSVTVCKHDK